MATKDPTQSARPKGPLPTLEVTEEQIQWMSSLLAAAQSLGTASGASAELTPAQIEQANALFGYRVISAALARTDGSFATAPSPFANVVRRDRSLVFEDQAPGHKVSVTAQRNGSQVTETTSIENDGVAHLRVITPDESITGISVRDRSGVLVAVAGALAPTGATPGSPNPVPVPTTTYPEAE